jgi:hypothetical protein
MEHKEQYAMQRMDQKEFGVSVIHVSRVCGTPFVPKYKHLLTFPVTFDHSSYSKTFMKILFILL